MAAQSMQRKKFMVDTHCQKYPNMGFFSVILLKQPEPSLLSLPEPSLLSLPINTKCHCHCLTICVLAVSHSTFPQVKHLHCGIFLLGRQAKTPQGEMKCHGRPESSLTAKIPLWGSSSRNIAGSLCCPKVFHLKEQLMWIKFHFSDPLSLSSDTTTGGKWQSWVWLQRFIYHAWREVPIWEPFVIHEWSDLDLTDSEVGPRISAPLSKCLCKLLSQCYVPLHTFCYSFCVQNQPQNHWRQCKIS